MKLNWPWACKCQGLECTSHHWAAKSTQGWIYEMLVVGWAALWTLGRQREFEPRASKQVRWNTNKLKWEWDTGDLGWAQGQALWRANMWTWTRMTGRAVKQEEEEGLQAEESPKWGTWLGVVSRWRQRAWIKGQPVATHWAAHGWVTSWLCCVWTSFYILGTIAGFKPGNNLRVPPIGVKGPGALGDWKRPVRRLVRGDHGSAGWWEALMKVEVTGTLMY